MGRREIDIDEEELKEMLDILPTQQHVAEHFDVSQATISNRVRELGLTQARGITDKDNKIEFPSLTWEETKDILLKVQEQNSPTVGYEEVKIEINTKGNILLAHIIS